VAARKAAWAATGATIVSEEAITTTGGLAATRLVVRSAAGEAALYGFAALGERYIQLSGAGDLDRLSEIVATLRPALVADALDCAEPEEGTLTWVVCNVRDGILSRNLTAIHSFMADPFLIGYWRSQGHAATPREITAELLAQRLPADTSLPMAFTTDREAFPPLGGQPAEALLGPEVKIDLIVYSEGWGPEGQGAALLYFAQVGDRYLWHSLVYAPTHFDK
jgi:hypothetical protein